MAISSAGAEDDVKLVSTAQRIIKSLRTSNDATNDMVLILSSFDDRLSNLSGPTTSTVASDLPRLDSAEKVIIRHCQSSFDLLQATDDSREFLAAVDQTLDVIDEEDLQNKVDCMVRVNSVLNSAMSMLEDEFRRALTQREEISIDGDVSIDSISPDLIFGLREIAGRMIRGGYEKECCRVYITCRRKMFEEYLVNLGLERVGIEEIQRIGWNDLDVKMKIWIEALKTMVALILPREKRLCQQVFDGFESIFESCFIEATKLCIMHLLNFGEAVLIVKRSPEKLFRILDMYDALNGTLPCLKCLYDTDSGEFVSSEAILVFEGLGEVAKRTFAELETLVKGESSKKPVFGGGIHPLARYMMNYMRLIVDYSVTLNLLLESTVKESKNEIENGDEDDEDDEVGEISCLGRRLMSMISTLELTLEEKAKYYENKGMQCIFHMNNKLYILHKVRDSELGNLLGDGWMKRRRGVIRKYSTNYLRASWTTILSCLREDGIRGLSQNSLRKVIKEKLNNFNASFEEIYRTQTAWQVPDSQLKAELRISISEKLISAYRSFLGWIGSQFESERHAGKYIKYTAEELDAYLDDFFEGKPIVLHHIRRKRTSVE